MTIRIRTYKDRKVYQASLRVNGRRLAQQFSKKGDAEKWLRIQNEKRDVGELGHAATQTLDEFLQEWFPVYKQYVKPKTSYEANKLLKNWIRPNLGNKRLGQITPQDIKKISTLVLERGRSPRTANYVIAVIRKVFNDAIHEWNIGLKNPAAKLKPVREPEKKISFWTKDEVASFLKTAEEKMDRDCLLYRFLLNTGCRIGEACALHWEDIDLRNGSVCIRRNMNWESMSIQNSTKSGRIRYVGINDSLISELKKRLAARQSSSSKLVFPNLAGNAQALQNLTKRSFKVCIRMSGVKEISVHDLRHTFAAHFVMNGGSIYDLKAILGHSNIKMTERYAHLAPEYIRNRTAIVQF